MIFGRKGNTLSIVASLKKPPEKNRPEPEEIPSFAEPC
jgi:hypothetical protein